MPREMIVVPYRDEWNALYEAERHAVERALGNDLAAIHHIGSTAVEGLAAKPVIDILVLVHSLGDMDEHADRLERLGYENKGEFGIEGRRFFRKGGDESPTHHVHVYSKDDATTLRYLALRDYLRAFPKARREYAAVKRSAAELHRLDAEGYMAEKDRFVKEAERRALEWYGRAWRDGFGDAGEPSDSAASRLSE
jgi:GrpB-like predicted nucleotidyltransferase (UPF0157 family)